MISLSPASRGPCCTVRHVGGDGTGIGIPLVNLGDLIPVWVPPEGNRMPLFKSGRLDRCAIGNVECAGNATEKTAAREYLKLLTASSTTKETRMIARREFTKYRSNFPVSITNALEAWLILNEKEARWDCVRCLLRACAHQDSLFGITTIGMVPDLLCAIECVQSQTYPDTFAVALSRLHQLGMGPDIVKLLDVQRKMGTGGPGFHAFLDFLNYIG